ncbi:hypothetical protein IWQ62_001969 [Dispira parvispora]|uniref:Complex 1 LYR protein domain-containing protein n=1 Tax=Dispira parvispora TaxID=1520584 RepID=A0A9W8AX47_9FUNG|nr:hypothetical protein IWQ62_001969 [Dispira parvispora]
MSQNSLQLYRGLLREIRRLHKNVETRQVSQQELYQRFHSARQVSNPEQLRELNREGQDILTFLNGNRRHRELSDLYNLANRFTESEKVQLAATRVGLGLPRIGSDN